MGTIISEKMESSAVIIRRGRVGNDGSWPGPGTSFGSEYGRVNVRFDITLKHAELRACFNGATEISFVISVIKGYAAGDIPSGCSGWEFYDGPSMHDAVGKGLYQAGYSGLIYDSRGKSLEYELLSSRPLDERVVREAILLPAAERPVRIVIRTEFEGKWFATLGEYGSLSEAISAAKEAERGIRSRRNEVFLEFKGGQSEEVHRHPASVERTSMIYGGI